MLHFILEKFNHESSTAGDLLISFTSFSSNATKKKVWHIHIEKYIFQQWIYHLSHNFLAMEYFKYITMRTAWKFHFSEGFPLSVPSDASGPSLAFCCSFQACSVHSLLTILAVSQEVHLWHLSPRYYLKAAQQGFHRIKILSWIC